MTSVEDGDDIALDSTLLYYTLLYSTLLYSIVLLCTTVYSTLLCSIVLLCTVFYSALLTLLPPPLEALREAPEEDEEAGEMNHFLRSEPWTIDSRTEIAFRRAETSRGELELDFEGKFCGDVCGLCVFVSVCGLGRIALCVALVGCVCVCVSVCVGSGSG